MKQKRIFLIVVIILITLLSISIILNLILYRYANQSYLQLNGIRLDPLGVVFYEPSDPPATELDQQKDKVVFFGDSRAYQWPAPRNLNQFTFLNRGIGAQTSTQVVERFDKHIVPLKPDILVVQVCINDLKTIPLYPHLKRQIVDMCKSNLEQIVEKARSLGTTVILTTVFPVGDLPVERRLFWSDEVGEAISEVNEHIHTLKNEDVFIYDTAVVLTDQNGQVRAEYSHNFLHLNEAGYLAVSFSLRLGLATAVSHTAPTTTMRALGAGATVVTNTVTVFVHKVSPTSATIVTHAVAIFIYKIAVRSPPQRTLATGATVVTNTVAVFVHKVGSLIAVSLPPGARAAIITDTVIIGVDEVDAIAGIIVGGRRGIIRLRCAVGQGQRHTQG